MPTRPPKVTKKEILALAAKRHPRSKLTLREDRHAPTPEERQSRSSRKQEIRARIDEIKAKLDGRTPFDVLRPILEAVEPMEKRGERDVATCEKIVGASAIAREYVALCEESWRLMREEKTIDTYSYRWTLGELKGIGFYVEAQADTLEELAIKLSKVQ